MLRRCLVVELSQVSGQTRPPLGFPLQVRMTNRVAKPDVEAPIQTGGSIVDTNPPPAVLTNLTRLANGDLRFTVAGNAGATYRVLTSTNVASTNWTAVATNTPARGSFNFVVSNTAALPQQHFRVAQ
jgi:hypothetical protein